MKLQPNFQTNYRRLGTSATMILIAGLSMGNQKCEQADKPRTLKLEVEVGNVSARPVRLPTGETIDFPYVANALFYRQVMNSDHFVIAGSVPSPQTVASGAALKSGIAFKTAEEEARHESLVSDVSEYDVRTVKKYGFMRELERAALPLVTEMATGEMSKTAVSDDSLPACLYDLPAARLGGEVLSFEATWGVGLGIGYYNDGIEITSPNLSGNVDITRSKLEIGLRSDDPLTQNTLAIADGIANQSKVKFGVGFNAGLPLGVNFFFNTPLAEVIRKAMDTGLSKIVASHVSMMSSRKSWDDVWESRVIYDPVISNGDTHIGFRGGYRAGIQVGDTFTVTNLHYMWQGAPCDSMLKYKVPLTATPIAELEVVANGDNVSVAVVKKYLIEQKIAPGAMVRILKIKQPPPSKPKA